MANDTRIKIAQNKSSQPVGLPCNERRNVCSYNVLSTKSLKNFFLALILLQNTFWEILQEQVYTQNYLFISRLPESLGVLQEKPVRGAPPLPTVVSSVRAAGRVGFGRRWAPDRPPGLVTSPSSCREQQGRTMPRRGVRMNNKQPWSVAREAHGWT